MKRFVCGLVALFLIGCRTSAPTVPATPTARAAGSPTSRPVAPVAAKHPRLFAEFGKPRVDDYYWLREKDTPAVLDYLKAENAYTDAVLAPTADLQKTLVDEFESHTQLDDETVPYARDDGFVYFETTDKDSDYPRLYRRHGNQTPALLLDLNDLAKHADYIGLGDFAPSDDGKLLAYTIDSTGFRQYTLFVKDLATEKTLQESVERVTGVCWSNDGKTLFFSTEDEQTKRSNKVWRQTLGGKPELVYEETDELFNVGVGKTLDRAFIVITSSSYDTADARVIPASQPMAAPRTLAPRTYGLELYVGSHRDGAFFVRVNDTGRNFRLVTIADAGTLKDAVELIPHRADVYLEDVNCFRRHIVLSERAAGLPRLSLFDLASKSATPIAMPEPVYNVYFGRNEQFNTNKLRFGYQSLVTPGTVFEYDMDSGALVTLKRQPVPGGYDPSRYEQSMLYAPARDGQQIPISLVRRKNRPAGPMLIDVYGAYGIPEWVWFEPQRISLLDRGVAFAVLHVRGGGELGKLWHDHGRLMEKRNTFNDVIDATLFLQREKLTSPGQAVLSGASAGGMTVGAVLNQRPDLFKAALLGVPFVDVMNTMLDPSLPLTTGEYLEWGNPNDRPAYDYMMSYSPYDNLKAQYYPATLVYSSYFDSQVMYWEPAKYVAKRRALAIDHNPLLLSLTMTGGHGGPSGRTSEFETIAKQYAFVLWQLGIGK